MGVRECTIMDYRFSYTRPVWYSLLPFIEQTQTGGAACCRDDLFVNSIQCIKSVAAKNVFTVTTNSGFA
jgi:hypothetical protein